MIHTYLPILFLYKTRVSEIWKQIKILVSFNENIFDAMER
jgi:hypothetical protein